MDRITSRMAGSMMELCQIELDVNKDKRGNLVVAENLPFEIKRVLWFYMKMGLPRGGHATKNTDQILVAIGGEIQVTTTHEHNMKKWFMRSHQHRGLQIPAMAWRDIRCLSPVAIGLVFCSEPYDEEDYIRDWEEWNALREPG